MQFVSTELLRPTALGHEKSLFHDLVGKPSKHFQKKGE